MEMRWDRELVEGMRWREIRQVEGSRWGEEGARGQSYRYRAEQVTKWVRLRAWVACA